MHLISDPWLDSVHALKRALANGAITQAQYQEMFDALDASAAQDACDCVIPGCPRPAHSVQRGRALCAVCALKERSGRRG